MTGLYGAIHTLRLRKSLLLATLPLVVLAGCGTKVDYAGADNDAEPPTAAPGETLQEAPPFEQSTPAETIDSKQVPPSEAPIDPAVVTPPPTPDFATEDLLFGDDEQPSEADPPTDSAPEPEPVSREPAPSETAEAQGQPLPPWRTTPAEADSDSPPNAPMDDVFADLFGGGRSEDDSFDVESEASPPAEEASPEPAEVAIDDPVVSNPPSEESTPLPDFDPDDLFGDSEPLEEAEEVIVTVDPTPVEPTPSEPDIFSEPTPATEPLTVESDSLAWQPTRPEPFPDYEFPAAEAEPVEPVMPSLPPTPIDIDNTRHLAWLLGSKVSWAGLSHLQDAQLAAAPAGDDWQMAAIAELLGIAPPVDLASIADGATPARAISALLSETSRLASELAGKLGDDHAALMEVAVKTNTLLLLYEKNPALAAPVKRAVAAAAERAALPGDTWQPLIALLDESPSPQEVRAEVFRLQDAAELALR